MADSLADGNTRVDWVPTIASTSAPTTTELNAGTRLDTFMTPDGLVGFEPDTADVDTSALSSTFDFKVAGRASFSGTMLRLKKQGAADTFYASSTRDTTGYVVVRRNVDADTAWASAQKIEVYPVTLGETRNLPPESNAVAKWELPTKISSEPVIRAAVA